MCGIVGFVGKQSAAPILLKGLQQLEYRGYDSAGPTARPRTSTPIPICPMTGALPSCTTESSRTISPCAKS